MRIRTKLVVSLLALLALALSPSIGHADTSSEVTYCCGGEPNNSIPGIVGLHKDKKHRQKPQGRPPAAKAPDRGVNAEPAVEEGDRAAVVTPDREDGPPSGDAPKHGRPVVDTKQSISESRPVSEVSPRIAGPGAVHLDASGGGSSPLVPILIAVAVLAALSVGIAIRRERLRTTRR